MNEADKGWQHSPNATAGVILTTGRWRVGRGTIHAILLLAALAMPGRPMYAQADPAAPGKALDRVVLQLAWYHKFQFAGYYAAQLKGYYAEEGLEVELRQRNPDRLPVDAVLSGEADFGTANSDIMLLRMQGKPVVALACIMQHSPWALLVRADSGITALEDLVGKTLAMEMNYRNVEVLAMLRAEGLSTETMTFVKERAGVDDLFNGTADAQMCYISNQPFAVRERGGEPRVIRPITYGIDFYGDTLFTSERQIRRHPERVAAFRRASLRGWQYAMEHPAELIDHILLTYYADPRPHPVSYSRDLLGFEASVMAKELMHPTLVEIGHMSPHRWRRIADTYTAMGKAGPIDSLEDFMYDPTPQPDYRWLYVTVGLLVGVTLVGALAKVWNMGLQRAVAQRTRKLRESEARFRSYFDMGLVAMALTSPEKGWLQFNNRLCQILGYSREELATKTWSELTHPDDLAADVAQFDRVMAGDIDGYSMDKRFIRKDGRVVYASISATCLRRDDGTVDYFVALIQDITERKRREDSIAAELQLSRYAVGHTVDELLRAFLDETEKLTDSEIGFYHFLEADQVTLTLQAWSTNTLEHLCTAEGKGSHYPIDQAGVWVDCVRQGRPVIHNDYASLAHRKGMPDGHAPVVRELVVPVYRGDKIVAILGVGNKKTDYDDSDVKIVSDLANMAWDIVGRIRAEEALQASEALLNESQAIANIGSWERDLVADQLVWSDETYRILGLSPENFEPVYETFLAVVHPEDRAAVDETYLGSVREGKDHYEIEHRIIRRDNGAVRHVREECKHIRDASGKLVRSVGMIQDITARRQIEEQLVRASELKSKFIQVAGHELRTPLSYIMAVPKLMEPVDDVAKLKGAIRRMETKARRLSEIVQSMFKLMPEEGYGERLNRQQIAISEILERVRADCLPFVEERRQKLLLQQDDGIPLLQVDPHKIHDVIENLIGNAIKFTPEGGTIRVAAARFGDTDVQVSVADEGPGIPDRDLPNIFTPFYSTEDVLRHTSGSIGKMKHGMGLGLTVVKHFTEMHGGTVGVTTDEGGSTFTITLPLSPPAASGPADSV